MTHRFAILLLPLLLVACQPLADSSNAAMDSGKRVATDNQRKWNSLFTYTPPKGPQLPQSRYCYQMQADSVCYDSPQPHMSAKLIGYQDGANISSYQPGGGSLGVSGGEATAGYNTPYIQQSAAQQPVELKAVTSVDATPPTLVTSGPVTSSGAQPFYHTQSPYDKGAVTAKDIH